MTFKSSYEVLETPTPEPTKKVDPNVTPTPTPVPTVPVYVSPAPRVTPGPGPYMLTIRYMYMNGTPAAKTYTDTLSAGEDYLKNSPIIPGYKTVTLVVQGTMPNRDVQYVVIYVPEDSNASPVDDDEPYDGTKPYVQMGVCLE